MIEKLVALPPGMKVETLRETIEVFPIGARVTIDPEGEITAEITAILILSNGIQYQVVWWDGRLRKCEYLNEAEIQGTTPKQQIGFRNAEEVHKWSYSS